MWLFAAALPSCSPDHARRDRFLPRHRIHLPVGVARTVHSGRLDAGPSSRRRAAGDAPDDVVGQLIARDTTTVRGFVESLRLAKRDPRITGVLLMPSSLESPYWGKVQELRDAVLDFRKSGKMVVAFLEYGGDREYYLASAADRVFLLPTSALDLTGVASYEVFLRGTFDKLGAYPDFLQIGEYKTARQSAHAEGVHARASRDDRVAQSATCTSSWCAASPSARKKTEAGDAAAARPGAVLA